MERNLWGGLNALDYGHWTREFYGKPRGTLGRLKRCNEYGFKNTIRDGWPDWGYKIIQTLKPKFSLTWLIHNNYWHNIIFKILLDIKSDSKQAKSDTTLHRIYIDSYTYILHLYLCGKSLEN